MNLTDLEWLSRLETTALKYVYNLDFTIYQLADEMAMSYSAMFPKIKKITGLTPNQYIRLHSKNKVYYRDAFSRS